MLSFVKAEATWKGWGGVLVAQRFKVSSPAGDLSSHFLLSLYCLYNKKANSLVNDLSSHSKTMHTTEARTLRPELLT